MTSQILSFTIATLEKNELTLEVNDIFVEEKTGPQLEDSKIVISAGRGMVEVDNLKYVQELADKLKLYSTQIKALNSWQ